MTEEDEKRYRAAAHAMQSGVALVMQRDPSETTPKHLRTGVNSALVDSGALAELLIEKGLITKDEFVKKLAEVMEREKENYERRCRDLTGNEGVSIG